MLASLFMDVKMIFSPQSSLIYIDGFKPIGNIFRVEDHYGKEDFFDYLLELAFTWF